MKNHIVNINRKEVLGEAVVSVEFTPELRRFVCIMAKSLLSEMLLFKFTPEEFFQAYIKINEVYDFFNSRTVIQAKFVRNAIRVLTLRIEHCEREKMRWGFKETGEADSYFGVKSDKKMFIANPDNLIANHYNEQTMADMIAVRETLTLSLIQVTSEFE